MNYKFPLTWWPKTRKPYSFTILEAGKLKFRSEQSRVPSEGSEEDCPRVSSSFWWLFSCSVMSDSLRPHGLQHTRIPCPWPYPGVCSNSCPLSQWCHPTISSFGSSPSPPAFSLSQHQGLFQWVSSSHQVAKVLELQLQPQSFQWIFRVDLLWEGPFLPASGGC